VTGRITGAVDITDTVWGIRKLINNEVFDHSLLPKEIKYIFLFEVALPLPGYCSGSGSFIFVDMDRPKRQYHVLHL